MNFSYLKKIQYNSEVILTYTGISLIALMINHLSKGLANQLFFSIYRAPVTDILLYFRLFGHVLGHVNFEHFFNNFVIILLVGPMLEEKYGSKNMLIMILFTAFITGIINITFFNTGLIGASGIAFMMILLSSFANVEKGRIPVTLIVIIIIFVGKEIFNGFTIKDNISQMAHVIGGFCGGAFGFLIDKTNTKNKNFV